MNKRKLKVLNVLDSNIGKDSFTITDQVNLSVTSRDEGMSIGDVVQTLSELYNRKKIQEYLPGQDPSNLDSPYCTFVKKSIEEKQHPLRQPQPEHSSYHTSIGSL